MFFEVLVVNNNRIISTQMRLYPVTHRLWLTLNRLDEIFQQNAFLAKGKLLDIGGENTPYIEIFRPHIKKYVCVNLSKVQNSADENIVIDALKMKFSSSSFDTVLCTQVLEHIKYPQELVDKINSILKKGGYCILSTNMAWINHAVPDDYFRFTESGLKHLFRNFSSVKCCPAGGYVLTIFQFIALLTKPLPNFLAKPINFVLNVVGDKLDRIFYNGKLTPAIVVIAKK
jgi:SAM-dependent methyltransferase